MLATAQDCHAPNADRQATDGARESWLGLHTSSVTVTGSESFSGARSRRKDEKLQRFYELTMNVLHLNIHVQNSIAMLSSKYENST